MAFGKTSVGWVSIETMTKVRVWARPLVTALGVAALAGAGQLGVAYGLGLVRLTGNVPNDGVWSAQKTWVAWFALLAVLAGAAGGAWAARRRELILQWGTRIAVAAASGIGAAIVIPLTALPADAAVLAGGTARPALEVALAAGFGVVIGMVAATGALAVRLVAVSVTMLVALVWLLALISVVPSLGGADLPEVRLGVLDLPAISGSARSVISVLSAPVLALLVCGAVAGGARFLRRPPLPTAVASTAAPGLLAFAYLIGSPGTGDRAVQTSPYAGALIAVATGLLLSLLVGAVRMPSLRRAEDAPAGPVPPLPRPVSAPPAEPYSPAEPFSQPFSFAEPVSPAEPFSFAEPVSPAEPASFAEPVSPAEPASPTEPAPPAAPRTFDWPVSPAPPTPPAPPVSPAPPTEPPSTGVTRPASSPLLEPPEWARFTDPPEPEPPALAGETSAVAAEATGNEAGETPAEASPPPAKRLRLPRLSRAARAPKPPKPPKPPKKPKSLEQQPEPSEPPDVAIAAPPPVAAEPAPADPPAADPPADPPAEPPAEPPAAASPEPPARPSKRGKREEEHLDWISSLAGGAEPEEDESKGRRRLRRDPDQP